MAGRVFPSMKAAELLRLLHRVGYRTIRQSGSHRRMTAPGRAPLTFAFHDNQTLPPGLVKRILIQDAGLSADELDAIL